MIKIEITAVSRSDLLKQAEELFSAMFTLTPTGTGIAAPAGGNGKSKPEAVETVQEAAETTAPPRGRGRPPKGAAVRKEPEPEPAAEESVFGNTAPEPVPEKVPAKISKPELLKVLTKYVDAFGEPATVDLLAEHGGGATKVSMLSEQFYPAIYSAALAALPNS